jgi:predicted amidohydrolase
MIIDPWGTVLAQANDRLPPSEDNSGEDDGTFVMADIDLDYLEKIRTEMPLWKQRRGDVYPLL